MKHNSCPGWRSLAVIGLTVMCLETVRAGDPVQDAKGASLDETVTRLVDLLDSEDPAQRDRASEELIKLGARVRKALETKGKSPNSEVRARVAAILSEMDRLNRIRRVRPSPRASVEVQNVLIHEAAKQVFKPFGLRSTASFHGGSDPGKRISIKINDASLWEAVKAYSSVSGATAEEGNPGHIVVRGQPAKPPRYVVLDKGDLRFVGLLDRESGGSRLSVTLLLPPGTLPSYCELLNVKVRDNTNRLLEGNLSRQLRIPRRRVDRRRYAQCTEARLIYRSRSKVGQGPWVENALFTHKELGTATSITVEGTLVLGYPHDLEITRIDIRKDPVRETREWDKVQFSLHHYFVRPGQRRMELSMKPLDERIQVRRFTLWLETSEGARVTDLGQWEYPRPVNFGNSMVQSYGGVDLRASHLVVARSIGEDRIEIPFVLSGIPVPK